MLKAQALELDVAGGAMPGLLQVDAHPALYPGEFMFVIPSTNTGPTPLLIADGVDLRELDIGLELLSLGWPGFADVDGHLRASVPIVVDPSFADTPLYFQAITLGFGATLVDRISNPNAFWWGYAAQFRYRFTGNNDERAFATVLPRNDRRWMICGGGRGQLLAQTAHATTEIYDPLTDAFVAGPMLNVPRSLHQATLLPNGKWLFSGGVDGFNDPQAFCEVYDPVADTFTAVASMNTPRMGHTATVLGNGKVLVTGGLQALTVTPTQLNAIMDAVATSELYDPVANSWTVGPVMSTPRAAHMAVLRPDGKVLVAGGISWDPGGFPLGFTPDVRSSCQLYDPVANTFGAAPSMASKRSLIDPVPLGNNRWLFAGGINSLTLLNLGTPTATAEIYDAVANTWTTVGSMATTRSNHKAWPLGGGKFLLAGGGNGTLLSPVALSSTEIFSTATNTFGPGPAMNFARAGAAVFLSPQGQMHLFGGATSGGGITNSTEWYYF
jgi:hypothetical protein